ncbi:MAG: hypothetical protein WD969_03600 [Paracoccaceae bacterium]
MSDNHFDLSAARMHAAPGIGHNSGPAEGVSWRRYAWKRARKELLPARVPIEIVRIRVRRAQALGLAYPTYASILLGSGRDIVGFLFTVDGLQLRLRRQLELPADVQDRLRAIRDCNRLALSPPDEEAEAFRVELEAVAGARIDVACPAPSPGAQWRTARKAVQAALAPLGLPASGVVMIGARAEEAIWAEAARLARFLPTDDYFGNAAGAR